MQADAGGLRLEGFPANQAAYNGLYTCAANMGAAANMFPHPMIYVNERTKYLHVMSDGDWSVSTTQAGSGPSVRGPRFGVPGSGPSVSCLAWIAGGGPVPVGTRPWQFFDKAWVGRELTVTLVSIGFGRIVISEIETPSLPVNLV